MIKRQFYKLDHGDRDASNPSSSSSDSEVEAEAVEESEDSAIPEVKEDNESVSTTSGYKSEDSSANDIDVNSSGMLFSEDDAETRNETQILLSRELSSKCDSVELERKSNVLAGNESFPADMPSYILKCKSVFKCKICPRIICLTEDTLRAHLQSKRHARSEKLLNEGRLKVMLNSDGEIENQEVSEIHTENKEDNPKKKSKGQKQHKKRLRKKKRDYSSTRKTLSTKVPAKRRRKNEN